MSVSILPTPVALLVLAGLLLGAVASDLASRRIPNRLVGAGLVTAFALHAWALLAGGAPLAGASWAAPLWGLLAAGAALMPLYLLRACGAGDVKLMAMVGAFVGPMGGLSAVLATLLAGGVLSLVFMLFHGVAAQTLTNVRAILVTWHASLTTGHGGAVPPPMQATAARLPYGVAIACGTVATLLWRGVPA
jgi:prepilin peptidase CpaA